MGALPETSARRGLSFLPGETQRSEFLMADAPDQMLAQLFPGLTAAARVSLLQQARLSNYPAEITLCHEGEIEDNFYLILAGRVEVYKILEGQRMIINQLAPGAHFGDLALLLDVPRTATIITAEPSRLLEIDREIFNNLLRTHPEIAVELSRLAVRRLLQQEEKRMMEIALLKKRDVPPGRVFVSYTRTDKEFVARLANDLLKQHVDVWLDMYRIEPGRSWARQVGEALDTCQSMLVVLTPASVASDNVDDEWNYYLDQKKPIVAVLREPCKIPYRLAKLQHIDFNVIPYEQALSRLVASLVVGVGVGLGVAN